MLCEKGVLIHLFKVSTHVSLKALCRLIWAKTVQYSLHAKGKHGSNITCSNCLSACVTCLQILSAGTTEAFHSILSFLKKYLPSKNSQSRIILSTHKMHFRITYIFYNKLQKYLNSKKVVNDNSNS